MEHTYGRCIYRTSVRLNRDKPPNDDTASVEHIVPWAVGGSNGCTTSDASKKGNNDLGSSVDAPFSNLLPIAAKRHLLGIEGISGDIPPIEFHATATTTGTPARIFLHADGKVEYKVDPEVEPPKPASNGEGSVRRINGTPGQVAAILDGMLKKAKRRGDRLHTHSGRPILTVDDIKEEVEVEYLDSFKARVTAFDQVVWTRGIMKIVLGLGHKVLGPEWTFGPNGDLIRSYLSDDPATWESKGVRGRIVHRLDRTLEHVLGITPVSKDRYTHTIAVLPAVRDLGMTAVVQLFGGKGVPAALVGIGPPVAALRPHRGMLNRWQQMGFHIHPQTRQTTPILCEDIDRKAGYSPQGRRLHRL